MDAPHLLSEKKNGILTLTLNRPERLNATTPDMHALMMKNLISAEHDPEVKVIVVTGAGRGFCSGGDVKAMNEQVNKGNTGRAWDLVLNPTRDDSLAQMRRMPKLIVAAVNGVAAGAGFNLALGCDMRIVSDKASFSQAFVKRGIHPDWGGTYFLPRMLGTAKALEYLCSGDTISAQQALELGLVNRVVPHESLAAETEKFVRKFAEGPPVVIGMIKAGVYANLEGSMKSGLMYESFAQVVVRATEDYKEGVRAFAEKRAPVFTGR
jgi:2-(1,2-epoxy-1,2-dihydrophenyl)acetyl-CoA isomerase